MRLRFGLRYSLPTALTALLVAASSAVSAGGASAAAATAHGSGPGTHVIVQASAHDVAQAKSSVRALGGTVGIDLDIINGFAATVPADAVAQLEHAPGVRTASPDAPAQLAGATYNPATDPGSPSGVANDIGSTTYWNAGFTGQNIGVALIDSGVAPVNGLATPGKVIYGPDFTPTGYFTEVRGLDTFGHGTFMAGLIAGKDNGLTAPYNLQSSSFLGTAPDAHIVSVKVADAQGATTQSAIIAAIGWVVSHRNDSGLNMRVLNLSLGVRTGVAYTNDPLAAAAEAAWKSGIVVVTAAGNDNTVGLLSPAYDPYVIAVAAVDTKSAQNNGDDMIATFTNKGDGVRNPDFATVGTHVVSLRDPGSAIDQQYGTGAGSVNSQLMRGSGTSESAAITSGAVALLLSQRPNLTPDQAKATLKVHATWMNNPTQGGQGELNMGWTFNAATETGTQSFASASNGTVNTPYISAGASRTPAGAAWTGATWTTGSWTGARWTGATWTGARWTGAAWTGATWTGARWTGAAWTGATWTSGLWQTASQS